MLNDTNLSEPSLNKSKTVTTNETEFGFINFNSKLVQNSTNDKQTGASKILLEAESTGSAGTTPNPKIASLKSAKERG